jgi:hypothetical protein
MVWFRAQLLKLFARPVLIPVAVGGFGLWYGTFNLTYLSTSFLGNSLLGAPKDPLPQSTKFIASGCGITTGIAAWYVAKLAYPSHWISPTATFEYQGLKDLLPLAKNAISSLHNYPVKRLYSLVILCGVFSGFGKTTFERIFQSDSEEIPKQISA